MSALRLAVLALAVTTALPVAAAPASAATPLVQTNSFAGYEVSKPVGKVTSAFAQFTVPKITCKKSFSGVGPAVFVDTLKTESAAAVGVVCEQGKAIYQAVLLVNGVETNDFNMHPGDVVKATVTVMPKGTTVNIRDVTAKLGKTLKGKGGKAYAAQIGNAGIAFNNVAAGIDPFTTTSFKNVTVSGHKLGAEGAFGAERVRKHIVEMAPTKIVHKKNFTVVFKHS